jgi:3-hydroxyisobutyrate dehydrogenase
LAKRISEKLIKEKNIFSIDAPVSGGDYGAKEGILSVMCGGDSTTFEKIKPIMSCYGANI